MSESETPIEPVFDPFFGVNSDPGIYQGQVPLSDEWNVWFGGKVDGDGGYLTNPTVIGDMTLSDGSPAVSQAYVDAVVADSGAGIPEAPTDGVYYARVNNAWAPAPTTLDPPVVGGSMSVVGSFTVTGDSNFNGIVYSSVTSGTSFFAQGADGSSVNTNVGNWTGFDLSRDTSGSGVYLSINTDSGAKPLWGLEVDGPVSDFIFWGYDDSGEDFKALTLARAIGAVIVGDVADSSIYSDIYAKLAVAGSVLIGSNVDPGYMLNVIGDGGVGIQRTDNTFGMLLEESTGWCGITMWRPMTTTGAAYLQLSTTVANVSNTARWGIEMAGAEVGANAGSDVRFWNSDDLGNHIAAYPALAMWRKTGNISIGNNADGGFRLDVTGTLRVSGALTLPAQSITYSALPTEVQQYPIIFSFPGSYSGSNVAYMIAPMALTIPANLAGTILYASAGMATLFSCTLDKISGGVTTNIGTITRNPSSVAGSATSLAAGDAIRYTAGVAPAGTTNFILTVMCNKT